MPEALADGLLAMLAYLASINILLLVFNLIPAFPLDGGRIARAIVWKVTGDRTQATNVAAALGQGFSYILIGGSGSSSRSLRGDMIGGLWLVFIGMFLGQAARGAAYQTAVLSKIEGVRVADVMDAEPVAIPGDMTVERGAARVLPALPLRLVPGGGRATAASSGVVDRERAERIPEDRQTVFKVREIMSADEDSLRVPLGRAARGAARRPSRCCSIGALMAVDRDGRLPGSGHLGPGAARRSSRAWPAPKAGIPVTPVARPSLSLA